MREQLDIGDEELLQFVEAWIDDLARGDFAGAFARTKHDPYYGWTPDLTASFRVEAVADGVEIFLEDIHVY